MSRLTPLHRAEAAQERVSARAQDAASWPKYRTIALKLPVLVHTEGLVAALHFVAARGEKAQKLILDDLARDLGHPNQAALLDDLRKLDAAQLRHAQRDVLRRLGWYKRLVQTFGKDAVPPQERGT